MSPPVFTTRLAGGVGEHPGVVGPVDGVGRAFRPGQIGDRRAGDQEHLVLLPRDVAARRAPRRNSARRRWRRRWSTSNHCRAMLEPTSGLFWWSATDDLDLHVVGGGIEILHRHLGGGDRAGAGDVGVKARHVGEHADLDVDRLWACAAVVISAAAANARLAANFITLLPLCGLFGPRLRISDSEIVVQLCRIGL